MVKFLKTGRDGLCPVRIGRACVPTRRAGRDGLCPVRGRDEARPSLSRIVRCAVVATAIVFLFPFLATAESVDAFALHRAEFAKYHRQITGRDAAEGVVRFAIDPKVSKSGRDAYWIVSTREDRDVGRDALRRVRIGRDGLCPVRDRDEARPSRVTITGSNLRSVWYGLYDLLERRGGCHWFWDGDVVPKKDAIDLSDLDVHEEAHFEYRAIRYFAHRGLTRFQAEHWGLEDWKREIDWLLKRRLNTFMLRIGQDDLFQRAFPETCPYPDASKPQRGMYMGYNDRTLFWSLEYRGKLRHDLQKYAFDRGLMAPEDFGPMSHWYSPTPDSYLANKKPPFLPQCNKTHGEPHLRVWDVRDDRWTDEYWKLTKTSIEEYGKDAPAPRLLHTIGLGERRCYKDCKANLDLKVETMNKFLSLAKRDFPDAKVLLASWDFLTWTPEEVNEYLGTLDKEQVILWDYSGDRPYFNSHLSKWNVRGKFPYTYSVFLAFDRALDARANYPLIERRQKIVRNDPCCKGFILWPEASHTDTLFLDFFTANAWSEETIPHGKVLDEFCANRYGANAAVMKAAWAAALPASRQRDCGGSYADNVNSIGRVTKLNPESIARWVAPVTEAKKAFEILQSVQWRDPFVQRDSVDIARMVLDRILTLRRLEFNRDFTAWRNGDGMGAGKTASVLQQDGLVAQAKRLATLCDVMADLLALHTDFSLWESYQRLDAIEKIRNPDFEKTLFENASCTYCRSHQYELARHFYAPHAHAFAARLAKAVAAGDRKVDVRVNAEVMRLALKARPLESLKPTLPRTEENFRKVLREIQKAVN